MSCNCKKKNTNNMVDELEAFQLIKTAVIDNISISRGQKEILYKYYNQKFDAAVPLTCANCWDTTIKEKLNQLWIEKSIESQQS